MGNASNAPLGLNEIHSDEFKELQEKAYRNDIARLHKPMGADFQRYLVDHKLSGNMRVIARKTANPS